MARKPIPRIETPAPVESPKPVVLETQVVEEAVPEIVPEPVPVIPSRVVSMDAVVNVRALCPNRYRCLTVCVRPDKTYSVGEYIVLGDTDAARLLGLDAIEPAP